MNKITSTTRITPWGNSHGVILNQAILKQANLQVGEKIQVSTKLINGHTAVVLEPIENLTLAEKYAQYQGTAETYRYSPEDDVWNESKPVGQELW